MGPLQSLQDSEEEEAVRASERTRCISVSPLTAETPNPAYSEFWLCFCCLFFLISNSFTSHSPRAGFMGHMRVPHRFVSSCVKLERTVCWGLDAVALPWLTHLLECL